MATCSRHKNMRILAKYKNRACQANVMPGIGLMKRRIETAEQASALAVSGVAKQQACDPGSITIVETLFHEDAGDWYAAARHGKSVFIVQMDSVLGSITGIAEKK